MHRRIHPESSARNQYEAFTIAKQLMDQRSNKLIGRLIGFGKLSKAQEEKIFGKKDERGFLILNEGKFLTDENIKKIKDHNKQARLDGRKKDVIRNPETWNINKLEEMITGIIKYNPKTGEIIRGSKKNFGILNKLGILTPEMKDYANRWVITREALEKATRTLNLPQRFKQQFDTVDNFFQLMEQFGFNPQAKDFRAMIPKGNKEIIELINKSYGVQGYVPRIVAKFNDQTGEREEIGFLMGKYDDLKLVTPRQAGSSSKWNSPRTVESVDDLLNKGYVLLDNYEIKGLFISNRIRKLGFLQQAQKLQSLADQGLLGAEVKATYAERILLNLHIAEWKEINNEGEWKNKYVEARPEEQVTEQEAKNAYEITARAEGLKKIEENVDPSIKIKYDEHTYWKQNLQLFLDNLLGKEKSKYITKINENEFDIDFVKIVEEKGLKETIPLLKYMVESDIHPSLSIFKKAWTPTTTKDFLKFAGDLLESFGEEKSIKFFGTSDPIAFAAIINIKHLDE